MRKRKNRELDPKHLTHRRFHDVPPRRIPKKKRKGEIATFTRESPFPLEKLPRNLPRFLLRFPLLFLYRANNSHWLLPFISSPHRLFLSRFFLAIVTTKPYFVSHLVLDKIALAKICRSNGIFSWNLCSGGCFSDRTPKTRQRSTRVINTDHPLSTHCQ